MIARPALGSVVGEDRFPRWTPAVPLFALRSAACAAFVLFAASPSWADPPVGSLGQPGDGMFLDAPADDVPSDVASSAVAVPGAASTEPVLRCVYRPHPTRVRAVAAFLEAHADRDVTVSLRPAEHLKNEPLREVTRNEQVTATFPDGSTQQMSRQVTRLIDGDGQPAEMELVVVAPPEKQRAIAQFLALCVSADSMPLGPPTRSADGYGSYYGGSEWGQLSHPFDDVPPDGYQDPLPDAFGSQIAPSCSGPGCIEIPKYSRDQQGIEDDRTEESGTLPKPSSVPSVPTY